MLARPRESTQHSTNLVASDNTPQPPPRIELGCPLIVLNVREGRPRTFFGYASNISVAGMRIAATSPREPGSRYRLEIPFPEPVGLTAECECEVVWKSCWVKGDPVGPGMGLRFLDLPERISDALAAWIRREAFEGRLRPSGR